MDVWAMGVTLYCFVYGQVSVADISQWLLLALAL